jgi:membrane-associated protease RseP (regulator of RpoE activity)
VLIEVIFRRKVKRTVEQLFHGLGFLALLFLMLFVTYFDIVKAFTQ